MSTSAADRNGQSSELVFCHACQNEWLRNEHGLECPDCHSDAVEIIEEHSDPRDNLIDIDDENDDDDDDDMAMPNRSADSLPQHPLHHHNPWRSEAPDPEDPNIQHVEWNPGPGVHFARTTYRSSTPGGFQNRGQSDPFAPLFQSFSTMFEGVNAQARAQAQGGDIHSMDSPGDTRRPGFATQNPFPDHQHHHVYHRHGPYNGPHSSRNVFTASGRWPPQGQGPFPNNHTGNATHNILTQLLAQMQASIAAQNPNNPAMNTMPGFLSQILGAGPHGDAVYTDEALDRIITQMMEQTNPDTAPGPASAAAIAALPQKEIDKAMLGSDGKAECSVCMEPVELGEQVTELPCHHWFHGECVGAWLKEHDTCPHCRQGIMPKDAPAESASPRSPNQAPQNFQNPFAQAFNNGRPQRQQSPMPGQFPMPHSPNSTSPNQPNPILQPGAFLQQQSPTSAGAQQPPMQGTFRQYPAPRSHAPPNAPYQQQQQQPYPPSSNAPSHSPSSTRLRREGSRQQSSSSGNLRNNGNGGEGSSSGGSGVTGWFRNLRGSGGNR